MSTVSTELNLSRSHSGPQMKVMCPLQPHMESRCYQRHLKALFQISVLESLSLSTVDPLQAPWKSPGTAVETAAGSHAHLTPPSLLPGLQPQGAPPPSQTSCQVPLCLLVYPSCYSHTTHSVVDHSPQEEPNLPQDLLCNVGPGEMPLVGPQSRQASWQMLL